MNKCTYDIDIDKHCHEKDKEGNELCVPLHDAYHHCEDCHGDCRCFDPEG